jgi:hypothetical protein
MIGVYWLYLRFLAALKAERSYFRRQQRISREARRKGGASMQPLFVMFALWD